MHSKGYGPEMITIDTYGYKFLHYVGNYAVTPSFDDVNCTASIYGFGNSDPIQISIKGSERFYIVGCFRSANDIIFIDSNVSTEPSKYPSECPLVLGRFQNSSVPVLILYKHSVPVPTGFT